MIQDLQRAITKARDAGKSAVFVGDHESLPLNFRQALLAQELNHVRQRLLGPTDQHLGASAEPFVESPLGTKAKNSLERALQGYNFEGNSHVAAVEIGERLMRPGAHSELGLSGAERDVLAEQYVQYLKEEYGDKAENIIARIRHPRATPWRKGHCRISREMGLRPTEGTHDFAPA